MAEASAVAVAATSSAKIARGRSASRMSSERWLLAFVDGSVRWALGCADDEPRVVAMFYSLIVCRACCRSLFVRMEVKWGAPPRMFAFGCGYSTYGGCCGSDSSVADLWRSSRSRLCVGVSVRGEVRARVRPSILCLVEGVRLCERA